MDNINKYEFLLEEDYKALENKDENTVYFTSENLTLLVDRIIDLCKRHIEDEELKNGAKRAVKRYILNNIDNNGKE